MCLILMLIEVIFANTLLSLLALFTKNVHVTYIALIVKIVDWNDLCWGTSIWESHDMFMRCRCSFYWVRAYIIIIKYYQIFRNVS